MATLREAIQGVSRGLEGDRQEGPTPTPTPSTAAEDAWRRSRGGGATQEEGGRPAYVPTAARQLTTTPDALLAGVTPSYRTRVGAREINLDDPEIQRERALAKDRYVYGDYTAEDINLLLATGDLTENQARDALERLTERGDGAPGGGGGGPSATAALNAATDRERLAFDREQFERYNIPSLEETLKQNRFTRQSTFLSALQTEQQLAQNRTQALLNTIIEAAPNLRRPGQEYYGGFGPSGGFTMLEQLQGGPGEPIRAESIGLPIGQLTESGAPDFAAIQDLLGPLV